MGKGGVVLKGECHKKTTFSRNQGCYIEKLGERGTAWDPSKSITSGKGLD